MNKTPRQKKHKRRLQEQAAQRQKPATRLARPRWLVVGLCVLLAALTAGATWALLEFVVFSRIPHDLVGKWVVERGEQEGATFDFFRNGTFTGRMNVQGNEGIVEGRVHVEGAKLLTTTRNPHTRKDETRTQTIKTLTREALVVEDDRGEVLRMKRADE
jgi:uncharacterized protein (TIGR03066 family)